MNKIHEKLYKYYRKKYLKYSNLILSEKEAKFEDYKIEHGNKFVCGIDDGTCYKEYCTKNFDKYGCMYLKGIYKK